MVGRSGFWLYNYFVNLLNFLNPPLPMKIYLHSIGCRLNHSEIETMGRQLLAAGHQVVADAAEADKVIINTCAVTAEAARDARVLTRRLHKLNDTADILLTGCYATIAPRELARVEGATAVIPNSHKAQLVQQIDPLINPDLPVYDQEPLLREFHAGTTSRTRAFIKVQDGCDNKCTFCVTTIARGAGQSRHLGDVVAEVQALASAGYLEAVLTGVHLGSYGRDLGHPHGLRDLVAALLTHTDMPRLRLSSLEPWEIAEGFFGLWENPRLLPHLHLPLQSGSERILRLMARKTRPESFRTLVEEAREHIPHLNLTTDLIVGFPGETEADFEESLAFTAAMNFSRIHAFSYSPRPGTAAATMPHHLPKQIKKERIGRVMAVAQELGRAYHEQYVGQTMPVLWESVLGADEAGLRLAGYTDNYMRVLGHGTADDLKHITAVHLTSADADGLTGLVVER